MKLLFTFLIFIIIFYFFRKRKIEGVIILLTIALLKFEISVGSKILPVYQIFSLPIVLYIILNKKKFFFHNHKILISVVLFIYGITFAAFFMRQESSLLGSFQMSFDYAFLFFITLFCLKNSADIFKLIKGLHLGVFLVSLVGIIGFLIDDPFFGFQEYGFVPSSGNYFERIAQYNEMNNTSMSLNRVRFSTSDPNSLGILMILGSVFSFFLLKKSNNRYNYMYFLLTLVLFIFINFLTASRTSLSLLIIFIIYILFNNKTKFFKNLFLVILLAYSSFLLVDFAGFFDLFFNRISDADSANTFNGRLIRWTYHFNKLNLEYIFFGNSYSGYQGFGSTISHSNYISLLYRGGIFAFFSYIFILYKLFYNKIDFLPFRILAVVFIVSGISQEIVSSYGPNFIFWPLVALLSFSTKYFKYNHAI